MPVAQALGVQRFTGGRLQQPHAGGAGATGQFGNQGQAAAIRRAPWIARNGQACRGKAGQLFEEFVSRFAAVEDASVADVFRQLRWPRAVVVQLDGDQ
ncbi:hypothetical protein D3C75_733040 [compost metagenome]